MEYVLMGTSFPIIFSKVTSFRKRQHCLVWNEYFVFKIWAGRMGATIGLDGDRRYVTRKRAFGTAWHSLALMSV